MTNQNTFVGKLFGLSKRVAVITGGGSGIGFRIAAALAKAGAAVVLMGRNESTLRQAQKTINNDNGRAASLSADLSDLAGIAKNAKAAVSFFGAPDIVVNAAGVNFRSSSDVSRSTDDITPATWQETMNINLGAPFFLTRALIYNMKAKGGGAIINIGFFAVLTGRAWRRRLYRLQRRRCTINKNNGARLGQIRHYRKRHFAGFFPHQLDARCL